MTIAIDADFCTTPYLHQLKEFELYAEDPARALLWQMRTGKTKVIIDTACHLYSTAKIRTVLVFAPNGVHENWARRELPTHHWKTINYATFVWKTALKNDKDQKELLQRVLRYQSLAWLCFSSSTMIREDVRSIIAAALKRQPAMVVFDESHEYRTPGSRRSYMARAVARRCEYRRILTGTLAENSPLHVWGQYELLGKGALGFETFGEFEREFAVYDNIQTSKGRAFKSLREYVNLDKLQKRIADWSSIVLRADCKDLPDIFRRERRVKLSKAQEKAYKEIHKDMELELENGEVISVGDSVSRLLRLQQVLSGYVRDPEKNTHILPGPNLRLEALLEEIQALGCRVIVWCQFQYDIDLVSKAMRDAGRKVVEYHGRISSEAKTLAREAMAPGTGAEGPDLVGQAQAGGSGLDLSAAGAILWYSHTFNAIVRRQADERATAVGGGNVQIIDLVAPGVDEYILENVLKKTTIADALSRDGLKEVLARTALPDKM